MMESLIDYDVRRDIASLTPAGADFMARLIIEDATEAELSPELPIGVLLVAANLVKAWWGIEGVDLHDVVSGAAFNSDMPACEMPGAVREIRRRLVAGLRGSDRWRNLWHRLPDLER